MRGGIDREGIGTWHATYMADNGLKSVAGDGRTTMNRDAVIGKAVALTGADTCGYGADGAPLLGAIYQYEYDGYVTVTTRGYVELPCVDGSEPAVGDVVCVNGAGAVKKWAPTMTFGAETHPVPVLYGPRVVSVDTTANTCVVFLG